MNITTLIKHSQKPSLYQEGTSVMWTDPYISKKLLNYHIDPNNDMASRSDKKINLIVDWIISTVNKKELTILDLGCGPGLYAEKFAQRGHQVTGVDFSKQAIEYAKNTTQKNKSGIDYYCQNYLDIQYEEKFDLVILIYLDFCVLKPAERTIVLENIYKSLKKGGMFIFDVVNGRNIDEKVLKQSWEIASNGFWKDEPYIAFNNGHHYPENKVLLNQHIIIDGSEKVDTYLFWSTYYEYEDLLPIIKAAKFSNINKCENLLPSDDIWNGENVTFYVVVK